MCVGKSCSTKKSSVWFRSLELPLCGKADVEALPCQPPGNAGVTRRVKLSLQAQHAPIPALGQGEGSTSPPYLSAEKKEGAGLRALSCHNRPRLEASFKHLSFDTDCSAMDNQLPVTLQITVNKLIFTSDNFKMFLG